jgi:hypothetical protein
MASSRAWTEEAYEKLPLPRSLQELVGRRLGGFPLAARTMLGAAALLGREVSLPLLEQSSGLQEEIFFDALGELLALPPQVYDSTISVATGGFGSGAKSALIS